MIVLLIGLLMGLTALVLVVYPLLGLDRNTDTAVLLAASRGESREPGYAGEMSERESAARQALFDVDFDYRLGNLDEEDYSQLRDRYEERALVALKGRYERERELDGLIEKQVAALKSQDRKATVSPRQPLRVNTVPGGQSKAPAGQSPSQRRRRKKGA